MSKRLINVYLLYIFINLNIISSKKYPIYSNIINSEHGNIKTILIKSKEQYLDFILKQNYVISLTEYTIYEKEPNIITIFDKLSSFKILKDWNFLKVQCYEKNPLCDLLSINITDKFFPSIKIYVKSQEIKTSSIMLDFNVSDFSEFLMKLSSNPIIEIKNNDINNFYINFGKFSPLVFYNKKNTEFISCINLLAKKKYFKFFYFGIISINDTNNTDIKEDIKERIIFDNDDMPVSKTWEGDCDEIDKFLGRNIYPLIIRVDKELIHNLILDQKTLVILMGYISNNEKIDKFINNEYKKLAYIYRDLDLVFGFDFYNELEENNYIKNKTKFKFVSKDINGIKILFYQFVDESYYIYPIVYKINSTNSDLIYNRINNIISRYPNLPFSSGSLFIDSIKRMGIYSFINDKKKMVTLGITFMLIILGIIFLCIFGVYKS